MLNLTEGVGRRPPPSLLRIFAKLGGWPKYYEENIDGQLWLNPGSCGRKRFNLPITMAVLNISNKYSIEKIEFY